MTHKLLQLYVDVREVIQASSSGLYDFREDITGTRRYLALAVNVLLSV